MDQENIEKLLTDAELHFTERCLRYQAYDVEFEKEILSEYSQWVLEIQIRCAEKERQKPGAFFQT